jgi:predicted ArsR family transcriptional regulator
MNITEERIIGALTTCGPVSADDLAAATGRTRPTVLRATRRLWLRLVVNREPIRTGLGGRPRMRYMLGLAAGAGHRKETGA